MIEYNHENLRESNSANKYSFSNFFKLNIYIKNIYRLVHTDKLMLIHLSFLNSFQRVTDLKIVCQISKARQQYRTTCTQEMASTT